MNLSKTISLILKFRILLIVVAVFIAFFLLFSISTKITDALYFGFFFQFLRIIHDFTIGYLPIPNLYIAIFCLLIYFYFVSKHFEKLLLKVCIPLITGVSWLLILFYSLWGFNYFKKPFVDQAELTIQNFDQAYIDSAFMVQTQILNQYSDLNIKSSALLMDVKQLNYSIRPILEELLAVWDIPTVGRVTVRALPAGSLLHIRTSGVYIPHALEGHFDSGLYRAQFPFTLAHEMAHGYGITEESACNFIAYLVCKAHPKREINYSAEIAYWRYLARNATRTLYKSEHGKLSDAIQNDLTEIRKHIIRYKDLMPKMRDVIYDNYLKTHGIASGIKNYDQMIVLLESYKSQ